MVDSPISVIRIAVCLSFRLDIICGTPFDVQLGLCANISALSPTILFPQTVFWIEAGCLFQTVVFQWTINDWIVT